MPSHPSLLGHNRLPPVSHIFGRNDNLAYRLRPYNLIIAFNHLSTRRGNNPWVSRNLTLRP